MLTVPPEAGAGSLVRKFQTSPSTIATGHLAGSR